MVDLTTPSGARRRPAVRRGWPRTIVSIVVAVAAILIVKAVLAAAAPRLFGDPEGEGRLVTIRHMDIVMRALDEYYAENQGYPTDEQGLAALLRPPTAPPKPLRWNRPYLTDESVLLDGWGRAFHYIDTDVRPGYRLWSLGRDNMEEGEGEDADICSWKRETLRP